jgi:hypothetical protein
MKAMLCHYTPLHSFQSPALFVTQTHYSRNCHHADSRQRCSIWYTCKLLTVPVPPIFLRTIIDVMLQLHDIGRQCRHLRCYAVFRVTFNPEADGSSRAQHISRPNSLQESSVTQNDGRRLPKCHARARIIMASTWKTTKGSVSTKITLVSLHHTTPHLLPSARIACHRYQIPEQLPPQIAL